jgi:hypothetical protein
MTVADYCALLAFEAALDGDLDRWRAYGALADALDRPGLVGTTIAIVANTTFARLEFRYHEGCDGAAAAPDSTS